MNAEQLNGILARLHESHRKLQTMEKLQGVRSSLEAVANNPADGALQEQYQANLLALNDTLVLPPLNNFTVRESKLIDELGLGVLVGERLRAAVSDAIVGVAITPRSAFDKLVTLHDKASTTLKKINRISSDLTELGIDKGGPRPSDIELGLYIPRDGGDLSLEQILEEGKELDTLVKLSYEAVEGKPHSPEVPYLTSCDYGYLLTVAPGVIWFLLLVIEKALDIRRKWADDRELFKRSRDLGHDEESVKALETKQEAKREQELDESVRILVQDQTGPDGPRKHEIIALMTKSVRLFIDKHERGSYIDVRVGDPPALPAETDGAPNTAELKALREKVALLQQIEQVSQRIHVLEGHGVAQMKSLPSPRD
ncbi:MAG TPA: hypothetical protein DHW63_04025 [Hyphomonadaceae bacterium]|nr:hypothetical protein [Hyphomonadaceae bacterium]